MKGSDVVPELLLGPVFSRYVVPELLPWRQQRDDVAAETGGPAAAPGHRSCWTPVPAAPPAPGAAAGSLPASLPSRYMGQNHSPGSPGPAARSRPASRGRERAIING